MNGGTLTGGGDFGANSFSWLSGTMSGTGRTYEMAGDVMTISGGFVGDRGASHTLDIRTLLNQGTINWQSDAGDIKLAEGANILNDGYGGEGVFEAWPNSTILPDNPNVTSSTFTVRDGGQFVKPPDEYLGYKWTSIDVPFENDSGTVQVDGGLTVGTYQQTSGLTRIGTLGSFTITYSNNPSAPDWDYWGRR